MDIEYIPENCLPMLRRLKLIDISHSLNLVRIESYAFKDNVNLQTIVLDGNKELSTGYSDGRGIREKAFSMVIELQNSKECVLQALPAYLVCSSCR